MCVCVCVCVVLVYVHSSPRLAIILHFWQVIAVEPIAASVHLLNKSIAESRLHEDAVTVITAAASDSNSHPTCMHSSTVNKAHSFVRPGPSSKEPTFSVLRMVSEVMYRLGMSGLWRLFGIPDLQQSTVLDYHGRPHKLSDCAWVESVVLGEDLSDRYVESLCSFKADNFGLQGRKRTL